MRLRKLIGELLIVAMCLSMLSGCGKTATADTNVSLADAVETTTDNNETTDANSQSLEAPLAKWVWSEIKDNISADMVTDPKDDFHLYVNKDWILENEILDGYSSYSQYTARQMNVDEEFRALLTDTSLTSDLALEVQGLYQAILDWDTRNELGFAPLYEELDKVDKINSVEDFYKYATTVEDCYNKTFIGLGVANDLEDSNTNIVYISERNLLLGDSAEYTNRTSNGQLRYDFRLAVIEYMLDRMGRDKSEAQAMLDSALEFDAEFAKVTYTTEEQYADDFYDRCINKMTVAEACEIAKDYPLMDVLKSRGIDQVDIVNVQNLDNLAAVGSIITEENLPKIKNVLTIYLLLEYIEKLDEQAYRDCNEIVNNIYGTTGNISDEEMAADAVIELLPIQCQQLYVEVYGSEEKRQLITDTCKEVIATYEELLKKNDYLSQKTIDKAIEKLESIKINALYPDKWPDVSGCDVTGLSYVEAYKKLSFFNYSYNMSKAGTKVDKDMWIDIDDDINVMDCNAFYSSVDNSINMIIGMLGEPFYSADMGIEEIYGSLGAFWIGHEVSHAFDSVGSQFDKDGNYVSWWTEEDEEAFSKRIEKVNEYLSSFEVKDGMYVNGSNVNTEIVADYTGLQCALLMAEKVENFDYDKFFRMYAAMNASISTESSEISQLLTDNHPLNYFRTNIPVQQFEEFYETYDVKPGDGMYLAPEERIIVW